MKYSVPILIALCGFDVALTWVALNHGAVEGNPLPWARPDFLFAAKLVAVAIVLPMFYYLRAWRPGVWLARGLCLAMAGVVVNNLWRL